ncbi:MAG: MgtC/SapB family protein [Bacilli bacterium]|nr:MgtC/SapB family protein [Bacilli bacterium]
MVTIDQIIAEYLNEWTFTAGGKVWPIGNMVACIIALVLSVFLCSLIGIEREKRGRTAGLRTHLLVGVGSCLIMIISIYGFPAVFGEKRDVARLAAQIIAGVGFLGAGAIIHRSSGTRGLTTAATIWIVMAIGLACGSFNFILALLGTLLIIVILTVFRRLESKLTKKTPMLIVRSKAGVAVIANIMRVAQEFECTITDLHSELFDNGDVELTFQASSNTNEFEQSEFIERIKLVDGVINVNVLNAHQK